jgi:hypothetical protein
MNNFNLERTLKTDRMMFKPNTKCRPKEKGFKKEEISKILSAHNNFRKKVLKGKCLNIILAFVMTVNLTKKIDVKN